MKTLKKQEAAEEALLAAMLIEGKDDYLDNALYQCASSLYYFQGDYEMALRYGVRLLDTLPRTKDSFEAFNIIYNASMALGEWYGLLGRYDLAMQHFEIASESNGTSTEAMTDFDCASAATSGDVGPCVERWQNFNGRYFRMIPLRAMNCDWRHREEDEIVMAVSGQLLFFDVADDAVDPLLGRTGRPPQRLLLRVPKRFRLRGRRKRSTPHVVP
jgi:tetratricopeptide (TPR) repeat protein